MGKLIKLDSHKIYIYVLIKSNKITLESIRYIYT